MQGQSGQKQLIVEVIPRVIWRGQLKQQPTAKREGQRPVTSSQSSGSGQRVSQSQIHLIGFMLHYPRSGHIRDSEIPASTSEAYSKLSSIKPVDDLEIHGLDGSTPTLLAKLERGLLACYKESVMPPQATVHFSGNSQAFRPPPTNIRRFENRKPSRFPDATVVWPGSHPISRKAIGTCYYSNGVVKRNIQAEK
ncbi:hypothetical protein DFH29DRAFT_1052043 [Suillus ampliporus]|nr:hypothetical protein DFH29DRAFT_1052043 [Suillus ampliporus]